MTILLVMKKRERRQMMTMDSEARSPPSAEHNKMLKAKKQKAEVAKEENPLIHRLAEESSSVKTARWFSNPLFENIGTTASFATMTGPKGSAATKDVDDYDEDSDDAVE